MSWTLREKTLTTRLQDKMVNKIAGRQLMRMKKQNVSQLLKLVCSQAGKSFKKKKNECCIDDRWVLMMRFKSSMKNDFISTFVKLFRIINDAALSSSILIRVCTVNSLQSPTLQFTFFFPFSTWELREIFSTLDYIWWFLQNICMKEFSL